MLTVIYFDPLPPTPSSRKIFKVCLAILRHYAWKIQENFSIHNKVFAFQVNLFS